MTELKDPLSTNQSNSYGKMAYLTDTSVSIRTEVFVTASAIYLDQFDQIIKG